LKEVSNAVYTHTHTHTHTHITVQTINVYFSLNNKTNYLQQTIKIK